MIKRYFLYDPEGDGFQAFATAEARDEAAAKALPLYIVDGEWDETVFEVVAGEITHITEKTNVVRRPDDLNDDSEDASGEYWQPYTSEKFNVKMQPAPACEAAARERDAAYEDARQMQARLQRLINANPDTEAHLDRIDLLENRCRALTAQVETATRDRAKAVSRAARKLADLRARLEALCVEMETDDRAGKLAHWIGAIRAELRKEAK